MATAQSSTTTTTTTNPAMRARSLTPAQWRDRAKDIAERDGLYARYERVDYDEQDRNGVRTYSVPSRSISDRRYSVTYTLATLEAQCECVAAQHGLPCGHVGAVLFEVETFEANVATWRQACGL